MNLQDALKQIDALLAHGDGSAACESHYCPCLSFNKEHPESDWLAWRTIKEALAYKSEMPECPKCLQVVRNCRCEEI